MDQINRKALLVPAIIALAFFSGCAVPTQTPEDIARTNETVKAFLEQYPDAEVVVTHFDEGAFEHIVEEIKADCDSPYVGAKEFYRVKIIDDGSGLYLTAWIDWKNKKIECVFKKGKEGPEEMCEPGWKCKDQDRKAYQKEDCAWEQETLCDWGCAIGECNEDICMGVECGDYCSGSTRFYNGRCAGGQCTYSSVECEHGCEGGMCEGDRCAGVVCEDYCVGNRRYHAGECVDGECNYVSQVCEHRCRNGACTEDPCLGITCPDTCDGDFKQYNGACVEGVGACHYSSTLCEHGCEGGLCVGDPCIGVMCDDYCSNGTRYHGGACVEGACHYSTTGCAADYCEDGVAYSGGECVDGECRYSGEACEYECEGNGCREYYCSWVWYQEITNKGTGTSLWRCSLAQPYCKAGTTQCCKYNFSTELHYDCVDCRETGNCTELYVDPCDGVVCPDTCDGSTRKYSGLCADGVCQYSSADCEHGCTSGVCETDPCAGVECPDTCDGDTRKYGGQCADGVCQYSSTVCEDGCSGGECVTLTAGVGTIFITKIGQDLGDGKWKGNLGGISGADAKCMSHAGSAGLSGKWIALISDSGTNAKDRIPDMVYKRLDGTVIANSKADLFDGSIAGKVNITEFGTTQPVGYDGGAWTGSSANGTSSGNNCGNWTSDSGTGTLGHSGFTNGDWLAYNVGGSCGNYPGLYCIMVPEADPCAGVECPDTCDGDTRKYGGQCADGVCQYSSTVCEDGCSGGECVTLTAGVGTIFVTSITWQGNLGGISGADAKCQSTATGAGFAGIWRALISDSTSNAKDWVPDTVYKRIDGAVIANSKADLFDGSIQALINITETGVVPATTLTWSGTTGSGVYSGLACNNWTNNIWNSGYKGTTGSASNTDSKWLQHSNDALCSNWGKLFCIMVPEADPCEGVECPDTCDGDTRKYGGQCADGVCQYSSTVCEDGCSGGECVTLTAETGTIFVADVFLYPGDIGGISGADSKCQSYASGAGLPGNWIALISDSSTHAKDRIPDTTYKRLDGAVIAASKADLFDGSIQSPININENLGTINRKTWTGSTSAGNSAGNDCSNWTFTGAGNTGMMGHGARTNSEWIAYSSGATCGNAASLYCIMATG